MHTNYAPAPSVRLSVASGPAKQSHSLAANRGGNQQLPTDFTMA